MEYVLSSPLREFLADFFLFHRKGPAALIHKCKMEKGTSYETKALRA